MVTTRTTAAAATDERSHDQTRKARGRLAGALRWPPLSSLRTRVLAAFIGLLAFATLASVLVTRQVLLSRLDQRIDAELVQESGELRQLAARGGDPEKMTCAGTPSGSGTDDRAAGHTGGARRRSR